MSKVLFNISLRNIVLAQKGIRPVILRDKPFPESLPYLDINALETGTVREFTYEELGTVLLDKDIAIVWDGSRSGLVLKGSYGILGSTLMKLTPIGIDSEYLFYFLKSKYDFINNNLVGGGIPHVNSELFYDLIIPYIDYEHQQQVVVDLKKKLLGITKLFVIHKNVFNNTLAKISNTGYQRENIIETISNFRQSILDKAITGELTKTWRERNAIEFPSLMENLGSVIETIKSGKSFRCQERPPERDEIGVLKISGVSLSGYKEEESKTCNDKLKINPDLFIREGDFLMTRANTKELVGLSAIVGKVRKNIMLSDKILRITFDDTKVLNRYILLFLQSKEGRRQIENCATGTQESMKNITQDDIRTLKLYIPSLKEQYIIIEQTTSLLNRIDAIEIRYKESLKTFENLEKAVLQQTFSNDYLSSYNLKRLDYQKIVSFLTEERKKLESEKRQAYISKKKNRDMIKKSIAGVSDFDIEDILKKNFGPVSAKEVWESSKYKNDIDSFYEAIKKKIPHTIQWELINPEKAVPESIISLKDMSDNEN